MASYWTSKSIGSDLTQESDRSMNSSLAQNVNGFTSMITKPHGYGYGYGYGPQIGFLSSQVHNTHGTRGGFMGNGDQSNQEKNMSLVPTIAAYPLLDGIPKNNGDSASLISPSPYIFKGGNTLRGRKRNNVIIAMEKNVNEKLLRRKIKNRESAARSRARKETHTIELEAEVEKLKKENRELLKKQEETSKMQTKPGMINLQGRPERKLRRTQSDLK